MVQSGACLWIASRLQDGSFNQVAANIATTQNELKQAGVDAGIIELNGIIDASNISDEQAEQLQWKQMNSETKQQDAFILKKHKLCVLYQLSDPSRIDMKFMETYGTFKRMAQFKNLLVAMAGGSAIITARQGGSENTGMISSFPLKLTPSLVPHHDFVEHALEVYTIHHEFECMLKALDLPLFCSFSSPVPVVDQYPIVILPSDQPPLQISSYFGSINKQTLLVNIHERVATCTTTNAWKLYTQVKHLNNIQNLSNEQLLDEFIQCVRSHLRHFGVKLNYHKFQKKKKQQFEYRLNLVHWKPFFNVFVHAKQHICLRDLIDNI
jgi:hypothetical protein